MESSLLLVDKGNPLIQQNTLFNIKYSVELVSSYEQNTLKQLD